MNIFLCNSVYKCNLLIYMFHIDDVFETVNIKSCIMKHYGLLIVDDEKRYADMLARRLQLRGITSCVCYDGGSALEIISRDPIPIVLLDLRLPDMYGLEVLAKIKAHRPETVVVILTAHGTHGDKEQSVALGAYAFMNKPLDIDWLVTLMDKIKGISS
jgi:two-component system, OmpR family, response regulator